jgi:hypothetical protein
MKKLILLLLLTGCSRPSTTHKVSYSPDGMDSIAVVNYFDGQQFNTFYLPYPLFKDLYNDGGYESVYDYYLAHELPEYWLKKYATYK